MAFVAQPHTPQPEEQQRKQDRADSAHYSRVADLPRTTVTNHCAISRVPLIGSAP